MPLELEVTHAVPAGEEVGLDGGLVDEVGGGLDELGDGLDGELVDGAGEPGDGLGDDWMRCAAQWTLADLAGHFGAAVTDTRVSFPAAIQA